MKTDGVEVKPDPSRQRRRWTTLALAAAALVASPAVAEVSISLCGGCLCIDYSTGSGSYIEVRCTTSGTGGGGDGGWTTIEPPSGPIPDGPGSFGGNGDPEEPSGVQPCSPVPGGAMTLKMNQAVDWARARLARVKARLPDGTTMTYPTTCTHLFRNAPLPTQGLTLLNPNSSFHAIFRSGEGNCTLPNGQPSPCGAGGAAAVTTCCDHSPYIFLCDSFGSLSRDEAGVRVIHELLHLVGQREDTTTTTGPGDPPTTTQLNDVVREACSSPQVITTAP